MNAKTARRALQILHRGNVAFATVAGGNGENNLRMKPVIFATRYIHPNRIVSVQWPRDAHVAEVHRNDGAGRVSGAKHNLWAFRPRLRRCAR